MYIHMIMKIYTSRNIQKHNLWVSYINNISFQTPTYFKNINLDLIQIRTYIYFFKCGVTPYDLFDKNYHHLELADILKSNLCS